IAIRSARSTSLGSTGSTTSARSCPSTTSSRRATTRRRSSLRESTSEMARVMDEGGSRSFRAALGEFATALGRAIHASEESVAHAVRVFERLSGPWAELPLGDRPPWPNDICDDGSPFELSAAFNDGRTELRMLVEPQEAPFTLASNWKAGLAVNDALAQHEGASLERFARIAPLFAPEEGDDAVFALWHAAVLESTGESLFKAYVNPRIHGAARAPSLVREAL